MTTVAVIGAGVAGATAAHVLRENGVEPVVLEAAASTGGRTLTFADDAFAVDSGAIFVMGSYATTLRYLTDSGHAASMHTWIARAAVMDETGRKSPVRFDRPWSFLRLPHLGLRDRVRLTATVARLATRRVSAPFDLDGLAAADDGTTLQEWAEATLGSRVYEYVVRPLMEPLTGADLSTISPAFTKALLGLPMRTRLTVPEGGLGRLTAWLLQDVEVRLSTPVTSVAVTDDVVTVSTPTGPVAVDGVVVATDVRTARGLLEGVADPAVVGALDDVTTLPFHHVLLGYHRDPWPDAPYDLVVQGGAGAHDHFGVLLNNRRHPRSAPHGGQTVSVYFDHAQVGGLSESAILARALDAVSRAFGPAEPDVHHVIGLDVSLVAPTPGHYSAMRAVRDAMPDRVRLAGDFLTHSGIEGAFLAGERAAHDLLLAAAGR